MLSSHRRAHPKGGPVVFTAERTIAVISGSGAFNISDMDPMNIGMERAAEIRYLDFLLGGHAEWESFDDGAAIIEVKTATEMLQLSEMLR
jgi:hypothetical protein